ncbi:RimK/LysX family protein [bacterium]|nr:RimK/LysX family protein [bacterium]
MAALINKLLCTSPALLLPLLLASCSAVPAQSPQDPRIEQVLAGMDRCLANQARTVEHLQAQELQLAQQSQQVEQLSRRVSTIQPAHAEGGGATAVTDHDCSGDEDVSGKLLVGQLEQVWLPNLGLALPGRIDTGAETASLDARNIELFERNGRRWVRFEIMHPETGEPLPMERRLKRMVTIVQSNSAEAERRPVIKLGITIGHISQTAEFTLTNRSHLDYQLLIGRNILQDVIIVDVSKKNVAPYALPSSGTETAR